MDEEFPKHIQALSDYGYVPPPAGHKCGQCGIDWSKYESKIASLEQNITGANELRKEFDSLLADRDKLKIEKEAYRESLALWLAYAAGENEPDYESADAEAAKVMAKGEKDV